MSDRAILFLSSVVLCFGGIAVAVWLIASGQTGTFDGNFMLLAALIVAAAFALYLRFLIRREMEAPAPPPPPAKAQVKAPPEREMAGKT